MTFQSFVTHAWYSICRSYVFLVFGICRCAQMSIDDFRVFLWILMYDVYLMKQSVLVSDKKTDILLGAASCPFKSMLTEASNLLCSPHCLQSFLWKCTVWRFQQNSPLVPPCFLDDVSTSVSALVCEDFSITFFHGCRAHPFALSRVFPTSPCYHSSVPPFWSGAPEPRRADAEETACHRCPMSVTHWGPCGPACHRPVALPSWAMQDISSTCFS